MLAVPSGVGYFSAMSARTLAYQLPVSAEDYLAAEETSVRRHEYFDGMVRAMAGETVEHNEIALNFTEELRKRTRGGPCRVFAHGIKVQPLADVPKIFYYPDVMVACDPRDTDNKVRRFPKLIIEVASKSTHQVDRCEKMLAYLQNETLEEYIIVQQDIPCVTLFRRSDGWAKEEVIGWDAQVKIKSLDLMLDMRTIYTGVLP